MESQVINVPWMFSLKIHLITYPGWKETISPNRPDKGAGQRKLAFSMKINSLKDTCQCLWQVLQNMRDDAATQFIFRAIMWPFIKLPSSRKKKSLSLFSKEKKDFSISFFFGAVTLAYFLPPLHDVLSSLGSVLKYFCNVTCWWNSAFTATNASKIGISSIFLTLFFLEKSILLWSDKISFVYNLFSKRWMNTSGNILLTWSHVIPELWTRDH